MIDMAALNFGVLFLLFVLGVATMLFLVFKFIVGLYIACFNG